MTSIVGIGLLGCGTVGQKVADRLVSEHKAIEHRARVRYALRAIAVRDLRKPRPNSLDRRLFTNDARAVVDDPNVDVVIELIGGESDAGQLIERALLRGRHVVTANKDLLGARGARLRAMASSAGTALCFEAAVAGAIPLVRTLSEALAGDAIRSFAGVINGTCTSILSGMERGADFSDALARAQRLGYAEADASKDVGGSDAAHKLAVLCQLAFGQAVESPRIRRTGIDGVTQRDVARACMLGYRIRLVAAARRGSRGISAEVGPVLVAADHDFARTTGSDNVVAIEGRDSGILILRGAGAGGAPTASAVLGDVLSILRAYGERPSPRSFDRGTPLESAIDVSPLFGLLACAALPEYPVWSDAALRVPLETVANA